MAKEDDDRKIHPIDQRSKIDKSPIKRKEAAEVVNASLRDKAVLEEAAFRDKGSKRGGYSRGYVATEIASGKKFLLKQFYKKESDCKTSDDSDSRGDCVQELIAGTMYQFLLHDQAPKVQLVTADEARPELLYVRYKYFEYASDLHAFAVAAQYGEIPPRTGGKTLKDIQGMERVVAACHILSEADANHDNILIVPDGEQIFESSKLTGRPMLQFAESCKAVKIDHGRSFMKFYQNFESIISDLGQNERLVQRGMELNVEKYSNALNQMISDLSEHQIEAIIDQKIDQLKKAGFDPSGILSEEQLQAQQKKHNDADVSMFDILKGHYKDVAKENLQNMKEIAKQVEIVAKFDIDDRVVTPEFKNGGWIVALARSPIKDPIQYAIANNIQINGLDAQVYQQQLLKSGKQEVQFVAAEDNPPLQHVVKELRDGLLSQKSGASPTAQKPLTPRKTPSIARS